MKNLIALSLIILSILFLQSCLTSKDKDSEGRLYATALHAAGGLNFTPMQHSDSNYVNTFKPEIYTYNGKPYTGTIASYEGEKLMLEGALADGIMNGNWKFYYPTGNVQIEGNYTNGIETGMWKSYFGKDRLKVCKYYNAKGYMLMRKEYFDNGKIKNFQNVNCPEFGNRERRIQFLYNGDIDYIDAEREIGKLSPAEINSLLQEDKLLQK